jgi:hypothetical protein
MSTIPIRIDGIGTRKDGSGGDSANFANEKQFRRLYATEALSKGDTVCIDFTVSTYGLGNHVKKATVGANATTCAVGVAAEKISSGDLGKIQVRGLCTFADIDDTNDAPGDALGAGANGGRFTIAVVGQTACAILVTEGTAGSNDTTVYLLNPANL